MPTLNVSELRVAFDRLLVAIEAKFGEEVAFDFDHYWDLFISDAFNLDKQPEVLAGQVSDDVISVSDFAKSDPAEFVSIWHECGHVAGVLRALAQKDDESTFQSQG